MTAPAKWIPSDDELDTLARSLAPLERSSARTEQTRTRVLALAGDTAQSPRRSQIPRIILIGGLAAAAALVIWLVLPPPSTHVTAEQAAPAREVIVALEPSQFEKASDWPEAELRVREGRLSVQVASTVPTERFRITTSDAVLDVRSSRFVLEVRQDRLVEILVEQGSIELRVEGGAPATIDAGSLWTRRKTARREVVSPPIAADTDTIDKPGRRPSRIVQRDGRTTDRRTRLETPPKQSEADRTPTPIDKSHAIDTPGNDAVKAPAPGETEFRRGWTALRGGDAAGAVSAFQSACRDLAANALAEDACYWSGVAAKRAGQNAVARDAFTRFLVRFPASLRAAEASALLGWLLYDAGDLEGAERRFKAGVRAQTASVRESAERGLLAIERKRKAR